MKKAFFLLFICFACRDQYCTETTEAGSLTSRNYYEDTLSGKDKTDVSPKIMTDSLVVRKQCHQDNPIFIYQPIDNTSKSDTLRLEQSRYTLNGNVLKLYESKTFLIKGRKLEVLKLGYSDTKKVSPFFYNLFVNDSLGIIMKRNLHQRSFIYEYGPGLDEIIKDIKNDSVFFSFK